MAFTVKQARQLSGNTQEKMAQLLNIHRTTYLKMEKNPSQITVKQAQNISAITGIPVDDIIFIPNSTESRDNNQRNDQQAV